MHKMKFTKTLCALAIGSVGIMGAMSAHAFSLSYGDVLFIDAGVNAYDSNGNFAGVSSGSWFAMDTNGNSKIASTEKVALSMGTTGLVIGATYAAGASHSGPVAPGDTNAITAPWEFFGSTGSDYLTVGVTGSTEAGLDFSGWTVTWNGVVIPMGTGAWTPAANIAGMAAGPYSNGVAKFSWDGKGGTVESGGMTYTLDYLATVPLGHPSGFGGVQYALHLEAAAVPEASTYGMMLAGLGLVGYAASRRRRSI
jgi:hypothetical protein